MAQITSDEEAYKDASEDNPWLAYTSVHPAHVLTQKAEDWGCDVSSSEFADKMDAEDRIACLREDFFYPLKKTLPGGQNLIRGQLLEKKNNSKPI